MAAPPFAGVSPYLYFNPHRKRRQFHYMHSQMNNQVSNSSFINKEINIDNR